MSEEDPKEVRYDYMFLLEDGSHSMFSIRLDYESLRILSTPKEPLPDWTRLDFHQCRDCPLNVEEHPRCPVAANMVELIDDFRDHVSYKKVQVCVEGENRRCVAETTLQKGIGALMGIIMVTSGCPTLDRLRPLVETHLPFMDLGESTYRILAMYLTAQYFRRRTDHSADWELRDLVATLKRVEHVNQDFCERLRSARIQDAALNALVNLNTSTGFTALAVQNDWLDRLEKLFLEHAGWEGQDVDGGSNP
ncbi:MAG: hypothetical protein N2C14_07445 [Planctomycetales bacterium]